MCFGNSIYDNDLKFTEYLSGLIYNKFNHKFHNIFKIVSNTNNPRQILQYIEISRANQMMFILGNVTDKIPMTAELVKLINQANFANLAVRMTNISDKEIDDIDGSLRVYANIIKDSGNFFTKLEGQYSYFLLCKKYS